MVDWNWQLWVIFCPLPSPPKTPKKSKFWKNEKKCWRYHHFTQVYQKPQLYEVQFLRYGVRQTEFFVILGHFLPSYPSNNYENQNFKTMKKASCNVIILHMCIKNHNHMMYASWDVEYDRHNFLSFWPIFCTFTPLLTPKIKIWNKLKKKPGYIILLHMCTINEDHMMYGSWEISHDKQSFLSFWISFCTLTFLTTWKIKILKKWKNHLKILSLYTCISQTMIIWCVWFLRYGAWQTEFFVILDYFFALFPP